MIKMCYYYYLINKDVLINTWHTKKNETTKLDKRKRITQLKSWVQKITSSQCIFHFVMFRMFCFFIQGFLSTSFFEFYPKRLKRNKRELTCSQISKILSGWLAMIRGERKFRDQTQGQVQQECSLHENRKIKTNKELRTVTETRKTDRSGTGLGR